MRKLMFAAVAAVCCAGAQAADVFTITELRAAISDRETYPDGSTITLAATSFDVGRGADTTPIKVNRPLTLTGESRTDTVISGNGVTRCLDITGTDVVLSNLTVADGYQGLTSGSITGVGVTITGARAKIVEVDFRDCNARMALETLTTGGNIRGGAIYVNAADCEVRDCRITDCTISNAGGGDKEQVTEGAGLYTENKTLKVYGTLFRNCVAVNSSTKNSSYSCGAAWGGAYYGCTFESNATWRAVPKEIFDASAVYGASVISGCFFRDNLASYLSAVFSPEKILITDSTFIGNVSSNGYGSCLHVNNVTADKFPVVERCLFESNVCLRVYCPNSSKARGGAISMDYIGGVVVSNCVFRGNRNSNADYGAAISGRSGSTISVYGSVFESNVGGTDIYDDGGAMIDVERCLFTGEAKRQGGAIWAELQGTGCLDVRNTLFKQVDATDGSVIYLKSTGGLATFENCSMVECKGTVFDANSDASRAYQSLDACCLWGNGSEGLGKVANVTYSYLATDTDATRAAENGNIVSGDDPGFWAGLKDLRIKEASVLRDAGGEAKPWMGDGSADGVLDMGNGRWSFEPCGTVSADGETYEVGAKIAFAKTHPRLVNGMPDIGCSEYMKTEEPEPEGTVVSTLEELRAALADPSGDATIILMDGTYDLSGEADPPMPVAIGRAVTLRGESRAGTVIDAGGVTRCLEITGNDVVVSNLTLAGGFIERTGDSIYGAGVYSTGDRTTLSGVDIRNCYGHVVLSDAEEKSLGGIGAYFSGAGSRLVGCRIADCGGFLEGAGTSKYQRSMGAGVCFAGSDGAAHATLFSRCAMTNSNPRKAGTSAYYDSFNAGAAYKGSYFGCVFESNEARRTGSKPTSYDAAAVYSATLVSNCLFRGNLATHFGTVFDTLKIADSTFVGNVSSNGYGSCVHVINVAASEFPVIERCLFESNVCLRVDYENNTKARGGAISMDYKGGVVVSNCVFRGNGNSNADYGAAISGRSDSTITVYGSVFESNIGGTDIYDDGDSVGAMIDVERCLFTGEAKRQGGAIWADLKASGYLRVRNSLFNQVDATDTDAIYLKSTGGLATFRNCSIVGCKGWIFGANNDTSRTYLSLAACCLYGNGAEGLDKVANVTRCYLATNKSGEELHNIVSSGDPGFVAYPTDLRLQDKSVLVDAGGTAEPWMGDGSKKGPQDMGDGTYAMVPSATITVAGEECEVGAKVTFGNAHQRLFHGIPDIGAGEYYCPPGMMLILR